MHIDFNNPALRKIMLKGAIGLEKESLRVTQDARLSQTKHPFSDEKITRDFCENQVEMITSPHSNVDDVYNELSFLHKHSCLQLENLENPEYLWLFSNPPYFENEDEIPIAHFEGIQKEKELYREYLASKYGKKKMLFSGIHFNYSFDEQLLINTYKNYSNSSYEEFKNQFYLELTQKILEYAWFLVYLTSASSVFDPSYFENEEEYKQYNNMFGSARCSEIGYWNQFIPILNYQSFEDYIQSIHTYVSGNILHSASELYYPVRLKPAGINTLESLKENGINHIELRMFDLNPLSEVGFMKEDIAFIQAFIVFLMSYDIRHPLTLNGQVQVISDMKEGAKLNSDTIKVSFRGNLLSIKEAASILLNEMNMLFYDNEDIKNIIQYQRNKVEQPFQRYCEIIWEQYHDSFTKKGLDLTKRYTSKFRG